MRVVDLIQYAHENYKDRVFDAILRDALDAKGAVLTTPQGLTTLVVRQESLAELIS